MKPKINIMSRNLNRRRIALMVSSSPTLDDFINKKLGSSKNNQRPVLIKPTKK